MTVSLFTPRNGDGSESGLCEGCNGSGMERWLGRDNAEEVGPCSVCRPLTLDEKLLHEHAAQGCKCARCKAFRNKNAAAKDEGQ